MAESEALQNLRRRLNQRAEKQGWKTDFGGTPMTVNADELPEPSQTEPKPEAVAPDKNVFGVEVSSDTREFLMDVTDPNELRRQEEGTTGMLDLVTSAAGTVVDEGLEKAGEFLFGPDTAVKLERLDNYQRKRIHDIASFTSKFYALNRDPEGLSDWIFSKDDEELAAAEKRTDAVNEQYLETVKMIFGLNDDQVGIRDGVPYVKFSDKTARIDLDADFVTQVMDQKLQVGGSILGAGVGAVHGGKKAGESNLEKRLIKFFARGAEKAGGPATRLANKAAQTLAGWSRPLLYSMGAGAAGAGTGQYGDDWYNSLYTGTKMKQGIRFRRAFQAAQAELEFGALAPVATGAAYVGVKALWNNTLGRLTPPIVKALRSQQAKMFDDKLVRAALLQANIDPDNPAARQQILDATNEFSFEGIRKGSGKDVSTAAGLSATSDVAQFVQPKGLQEAIEALPAKTKANAAEVAKAEKGIYDKFFGDSFQSGLNAQRRLNALEKEYPGLKDLPDAVAREVGVLKAGLAGFRPLDNISHLLTRPSFWSGKNQDTDFFGRKFMKRMAHAASGFKLLDTKIKWNLTSEKAAEATTAVPGSVAIGLRSKVLGQPTEGLGSVTQGINQGSASRANAFRFIEGIHNTARKAVSAGDAVAFDPISFRQFASVIDTNYEAAMQAVRSFAPKGRVFVIGDDAIPNINLQRALKEASTHDGNSADFIGDIGLRLASKEFDTEGLIDLAAEIRAWTRNHKFDSLNLPIGQKFLNEVLVEVDKKVASNLSTTAEGKRALGLLNQFRTLKRDLVEVRSNRAYQEIEEYAKNNVDGPLTAANIAEINKKVQASAIAPDGKGMSLLINKLPKQQGQALADHIIDSTVKRNVLKTADGFEILNTPAIVRELEGLRNSNLPFVKAKLDYLSNMNDTFGGFYRVAQMKPGKEVETKTIFQEAFKSTGGSMSKSWLSRWQMTFVGGTFNLMKKPVFDFLGLSSIKINQLTKATTQFFAKPLDVEASAAIKAQIESFKKGAAKVKDKTIQAEIEELESMVEQIQNAAASDSLGI